MSSSVFMAGAGKSAIAYPDNFFPYRGFRGRRLVGVHDDIYVRALLMELNGQRFLILSLELGDITNEWADEIGEKTDIPSDHIWFTVTHNHTAPYANSTWGEFVPDMEKTEPFCRSCIDAILRAAQQAQEALCPARILYGEGEAYVNVNRDKKYTGNQPEFTAPYITARNPRGYSDHTVSVLKFIDENDRAFAYLVGYAVHSSILFQQFFGDEGGNLVSGDLSGAAMHYVEERSDAVAIHLLGAAADQNARFSVCEMIPDREGNMHNVVRSDSGYDMVSYLAEEWGAEILDVSGRAAEIPADTLRTESMTITAPTKEKFEDGPPMSLPRGYEWKINGEADLTLYLMQIGSLALFGIPGEMVARAGDNYKRAMTERGFAHAMVVTQCNGSVSYMSDEDGYSKKTFEATQSHFAPGVSGLIGQAAVTLADRCLN